MGRSLRRAKKTRPKATMGKRKKPRTRAKTPLDIQMPSIAEKMAAQPTWDREKGLAFNYTRNRVQNNPNSGFGRNAAAAAAPAAERHEEEQEAESDDDLRAAEGKVRRSGKALPQKLTTHQQQIMQRLVQAHGDNVEAMARDSKLNPMLITAGKLKRMRAAFLLHGASGRCGFRTGRKGL